MEWAAPWQRQLTLELQTAQCAVVFNDMINHNIRPDPDRERAMLASGLVAAAASFVRSARSMGVPIYWVQVGKRADGTDSIPNLTDRLLANQLRSEAPVLAGSWDAQNIDELPVTDDDYVVVKPRMDPFFASDLDFLLRARGIRTVLIGGVSTPGGVESGVRSARDRGYDVIALRDCCYWIEEDLHRWSLEKVFPRWGRVLSSGEVVELWQNSASAPIVGVE